MSDEKKKDGENKAEDGKKKKGLPALIFVVAGAVLGGAGTVFGPLIGSAALTIINEGTRYAASVIPALKNVQPLSLIVYGLMLMLIVARLPDGLMSLFRRTRHA